MIREGYKSIVVGDLGQGKTLWAVYKLLQKRLQQRETIASNFHLDGRLNYTFLDTESGLFDLKKTFIVLDEADILFPCDCRLDGQVYYENIIKNMRKDGNELLLISQQCNLVNVRVRRVINSIIVTDLSPVWDKPRKIKVNGIEYLTKVQPRTILTATEFQYHDSKGLNGDFNRMSLLGRERVKNLYYFFSKYDTNERCVPMEKIDVHRQPRKIIIDPKSQSSTVKS